MATTLQKGLLGYDPLEMRLQDQKQWTTLYGQAQNPYERIGIALGQIGGQLFGGETAAQSQVSSLNKVLQEVGQQYTPESPEYYKAIAARLPDTMAESKASALAMAAKAEQEAQKSQMERVKFVTDNPSQLATASQVPGTQAKALLARLTAANNGQPLTEAQVATLQASPAFQNLVGLSAAQTAGEAKTVGNVGEQVNKEIFNKFLKIANGDRTLAAQLYDDYETNKKVKVSAASAIPPAGSVPLDVLKQGRSIVKDYTGEAGQNLKDIQIIAATGKALKTNSTLLPQFQTQIAQFTKDKQIGYKQIQNALGSSGLGADVVEGFNKFIEGKPTDIKIDDVLRGVQALEKVYGQQYNKGIEEARTLLTQGKITEETQKALLPSAYKFPVAPPKVGEVRGGYRFKGGDPSKKENYEALK